MLCVFCTDFLGAERVQESPKASHAGYLDAMEAVIPNPFSDQMEPVEEALSVHSAVIQQSKQGNQQDESNTEVQTEEDSMKALELHLNTGRGKQEQEEAPMFQNYEDSEALKAAEPDQKGLEDFANEVAALPACQDDGLEDIQQIVVPGPLLSPATSVEAGRRSSRQRTPKRKAEELEQLAPEKSVRPRKQQEPSQQGHATPHSTKGDKCACLSPALPPGWVMQVRF
jgi:cell fate (sporulation/competence/biofilm development) regulator YmcA (YheA/YmcA/DUF963 family)